MKAYKGAIWVLIEALIIFGIGIALYDNPKYKSIGEIVLALGLLFVIHGIVLGKKIEIFIDEKTKDLKKISKLQEVIDFSSNCRIDILQDVYNNYLAVSDLKLCDAKNSIVRDASKNLKILARYRKTNTLEQPEFYNWLYTEFDAAQEGDFIGAVSMDEELEWNDSEEEITYFEKNKDAVKRGVNLERIFVKNKKQLNKALKNVYIAEHLEGSNSGIKGFFVDLDNFKQKAPTDFNNAGQGFILINDNMVIVDVFSEDGAARGYVSFDPDEVQMYITTYKNLKNLSSRLSPNS